MNGLNIGGFKKNPSSTQEYDLDLSKKPEGEGTEPTTEPTVEPTTEPVVEPTEPVTEPTTTEPASVEPTVEPSTPTNDKGSGDEPQPNSSLTPNVSEPVTPESTVVEINDESALNYLSEKLGKPIQSFDELLQQPVNPLENDPYLKKLHEWRQKTGRPIEDWIKYQKDYGKLSDLDVAREFLQHEYPTFTPEEIDAELKAFQPNDDDLDDEAATKARTLKKYATKGRSVLGQLVSELGEATTSNFTPEVKEDLQLAKQVKEQFALNQKHQQEYNQGITQASSATESLKLQLSDDLAIDFKISDQSRKSLPETINTMPHWKNEDGSWNHQAVVNDAIKIQHFNDIMKLVYEQGLNAGKEALITETNNTTLGEPSPMGAGSQEGKKGVVIEGFDNFIGGNGMKVRFKK